MKKTVFSWLVLACFLWADAHIFVYHRFGDDRYPSTNTSIKELKEQFDYFKENGYEVIPLKKLVTAIKAGKDIPDNWVVLTIDDGYKSFYDNGLEVFKEYDYPFSMFVYTKGTNSGYKDYSSWEELKEISKYGSLEFHSYGHEHMTQLSNEEVQEDFKKGLELMEKNLGYTPKIFSWPYGEYSPRIKKIAKTFGFDAIINQNMGAISKESDIYSLDRTALVGKSNLPLYLRYKHLDAKWIQPDAYPKQKQVGLVHVKTDEKGKNAGIYLSGHGWEQVKMEDGIIKHNLDKKILKERSRILVSVGNKITTKLLIKDSYGTQ